MGLKVYQVCNLDFKSPFSKCHCKRKSASLLEKTDIFWIAPFYEVLKRKRRKKEKLCYSHIYYLSLYYIIVALEIQN